MHGVSVTRNWKYTVGQGHIGWRYMYIGRHRGRVECTLCGIECESALGS